LTIAAMAVALAAPAARAQDVDGPIGRVVIADTGDRTLGSLGTRLLNSRYSATETRHTGVAALLRQGDNFRFCSGNLLTTGRHLLTAAHCVTDGAGNQTVFGLNLRFRDTGSPTTNVNDVVRAGTVTAIRNGWSGQVGTDGLDLAIITLAEEAPSFAARYSIFEGNPLDQQIEMVGWGLKGDGNTGECCDFGANVRLRGTNRFEGGFAVGENRVFNTNNFTRTGEIGVLVADFDNGSLNRDSFCSNVLARCDRGFGLEETALGGGDSGGAAFINGQISGIASWGTSGFCNRYGDIAPSRDVSCFGAFNGWANAGTVANRAWIAQNTTVIPEPSTYALIATGLAGLAFIRRRRSTR
jgi:hypothetical protein